MKVKFLLLAVTFILFVSGCVSSPKNEIPILGENPSAAYEEVIAPGIVYSYQRYDKLFKTTVSISILKIDLQKSNLKIGFRMCDEKRMTPEEFGIKYNALTAVNAGYFVMRSVPPRPAWGRKINGKVVQKFDRPVNGGVVTFSADGKTVQIKPVKTLKDYDPEKDSAPTACLSQPLLVFKGKKYIEDPDSAYKNMIYAPRTVIGVCGNGTVYILVADGRTPQSKGLRYSEIQEIFLRHFNASEVLAMDGGGSAAMWIKSKGIVSFPSDNKCFDHNGTRPVHDAILVY